MEIFEGIVNLQGVLFVRPVTTGKIILAGVFPEWRRDHDERDELWVADTQITAVKKFRVDEEYAGYRIDQILCSNMRPTDFEEIRRI